MWKRHVFQSSCKTATHKYCKDQVKQHHCALLPFTVEWIPCKSRKQVGLWPTESFTIRSVLRSGSDLVCRTTSNISVYHRTDGILGPGHLSCQTSRLRPPESLGVGETSNQKCSQMKQFPLCFILLSAVIAVFDASGQTHFQTILSQSLYSNTFRIFDIAKQIQTAWNDVNTKRKTLKLHQQLIGANPSTERS